MVALVTPMKNDSVDEACLRELVEFHIESGTHGLVVAGTTGESGTLSHDEKRTVIKITVDAVRERIPVIAGTSANATKDCISLTREAMELGVDAVLIMTPAYIKPTQQGLYEHYSHIAEQVAIPVILYNVPGRTACDLLPETVAKLSKISNIIGIKEATGDMSRLKAILNGCGESLDVYSGDDPTAAEWMLNGAKGVISVTANVAARHMAKLCAAALDADKPLCLRLQEALMPLHELLFVESNPIPVKWAMHQMGLIPPDIRLPLTRLNALHHQALADELQRLQLV